MARCFYAVLVALWLLSPGAVLACNDADYNDINRVQFSQSGTTQVLSDAGGHDLGGGCGFNVDATASKVHASAYLCVKRNGTISPAAAGGLRPLKPDREIFDSLVAAVATARFLAINEPTLSPTSGNAVYSITVEHCGKTKSIGFVVAGLQAQRLATGQEPIAQLYVQLRKLIFSQMVMDNELARVVMTERLTTF